jgi:hypothetical protein
MTTSPKVSGMKMRRARGQYKRNRDLLIRKRDLLIRKRDLLVHILVSSMMLRARGHECVCVYVYMCVGV